MYTIMRFKSSLFLSNVYTIIFDISHIYIFVLQDIQLK